MRTLMIFLATALLLTGCATPSEQSASIAREMDRMMVVYGPACQKLGFNAQSDQWRSCILQLSTKDELSQANFQTNLAYSPRYRRWPY
jgi:hypothetical protein